MNCAAWQKIASLRRRLPPTWFWGTRRAVVAVQVRRGRSLVRERIDGPVQALTPRNPVAVCRQATSCGRPVRASGVGSGPEHGCGRLRPCAAVLRPPAGILVLRVWSGRMAGRGQKKSPCPMSGRGGRLGRLTPAVRGVPRGIPRGRLRRSLRLRLRRELRIPRRCGGRLRATPACRRGGQSERQLPFL